MSMNPLAWIAANWTTSRRRRVVAAYRRVFRGSDADIVLADLAIFCNANNPTFRAGQPDLSAHLEGARCVFLHIRSLLDLEPEDVPTPEDVEHQED